MAQHSGFWNSLLVNGEHDRRYNADDYSNNLAVIISDGVLRSSADDLRPVANGMGVDIGIGRAWIRGKHYYNDTVYNMVVPAAPTTYPRIDRIMLRFDKSLASRSILLHYEEGTPAASPVAPAPLDNDTYKDLVICDVYVAVNATEAVVTDKRADKEVCGWVYSVVGDESFFKSLDNSFAAWFMQKKDDLASVTVFKDHVWSGETVTAGQTVVAFDIPQYDPTGVDVIMVYFNGSLMVEGVDYTLENSVITFATAKSAGQRVVVHCWKSYDGTGLGSMVDKVVELENKVNALGDMSEYNYFATGAADNIALSEIAQAFLAGEDDGKTLTIKVYGNLGVASPNGGSGTTGDPYQWFTLGVTGTVSRRVCFDFENAGRVNITCGAGTQNTVFYGGNIRVKNLRLRVECNTANTVCVGFGDTTGNVLAENCVIYINGYSGCYVAANGVFRDCSFACVNSANVGRCYIPAAGSLLRIFGGDAFAYAASGRGSAAIYVASGIDAAVVADGVNFPTSARSGLSQGHAIYDLGNNKKSTYIGSITTLTVDAAGQNVYGTIAANRTKGTW